MKWKCEGGVDDENDDSEHRIIIIIDSCHCHHCHPLLSFVKAALSKIHRLKKRATLL